MGALTFLWCFVFACLNLQHHFILACDKKCQNNIIGGIEDVIDTKFMAFDSKIQGIIHTKISNAVTVINSEFGEINRRITFMDGQLSMLKSSYKLIEEELEVVTSTSSETKTEVTSLYHSMLMRSQGINRCPGGFMVGTQCFVSFRDQNVTWGEAETQCHSNGLVLAQTSDPTAGVLRRFLHTRHGMGTFWINAASNRTNNMTELGMAELRNDNSSTSNSECLALSDISKDTEFYHEQAYRSYNCETMHFTLCERLYEDDEDIKDPFKILEDNLSSQLMKVNQEIKDPFKTLEDSLSSQLMKVNQEMNSNRNVYVSGRDTINRGISSQTNTLSREIKSKTDVIMKKINRILTDTESIKSSTAALGSSLSTQMQNMERKQIESDKTLLSSIKFSCPPDFFHMGSTDQCFRYFSSGRTYDKAKQKCATVGALLAKPYDPVALRDYIVMRYGDSGTEAYLGARGVGGSVAWDRDDVTIPTSLPTWFSGHPGSFTSSGWCLTLLTSAYFMKSHPNTAYYMGTCTNTRPFICEFIR